MNSIKASRAAHDRKSCRNVVRPTSVGDRTVASAEASWAHVTECRNIGLDTEHSPHLIAQ